MRNRDIIEFLGIWEQLHNPSFKPLEFEGFKNENLNIYRQLYLFYPQISQPVADQSDINKLTVEA
jgi:hypothetical protein